MEVQFSFYPRVLTLRRFQLFETNELFILVGTDKMTKLAQVITIMKI